MSTDRIKPGRRRAGRLAAEILERRQHLATILVNSAGDADGLDERATLSLRQAIEMVDGTLPTSSLSPSQATLVSGPMGGVDTIDFAIPGTGPFVIKPTSPIPAIFRPVIIDGHSRPGSHPHTRGPNQGDDAALLIDLDGGRVSDKGSPGLELQGGSSLGTDVTGTLADANDAGVEDLGVSNTIGGGEPDDRRHGGRRGQRDLRQQPRRDQARRGRGLGAGQPRGHRR